VIAILVSSIVRQPTRNFLEQLNDRARPAASGGSCYGVALSKKLGLPDRAVFVCDPLIPICDPHRFDHNS
jgi:hypothetical protein